MLKIINVIVIIITVVSCGKNLDQSRSNNLLTANIIDGVLISKANTFSKHTVGLYNIKHDSVCTGVIIEENLILTAAHCVSETPAEKVEIIFGNKILDSEITKFKALKLIVHENYNLALIINDVALVRLPKAVPAGFSPIDIESSRQLNLTKGDKVTAIGYGVTGTGFFSIGSRGTLHMGKISIENYGVQNALVAIDQSIGSAICFGDSGGPTFTEIEGRVVLVGISSFVNSVKLKKKYICSDKAFLSNPNFFYSWIQESKLKI